MKKIVVIQKGILNDLKAFTEQYNQIQKPKLKIDVAAFFIGLINELNSHYRDNEEDNYTPLDSQVLKNYHSNYNKYFDFFTDYGILLKSNYGADIGKSNSVEFIAVDENGNAAAGRNLKVGLYRLPFVLNVQNINVLTSFGL